MATILALSVKNLSKSLGDRTLFQKVSFEISAGEKVALFGPNGCGKTTLFRIISGQVEPDEGVVWKKDRIRLGYLPQTGMFRGDQSVQAAARQICQASDERIAEALSRFGLAVHPAETLVGSLSSGERTRLGLACLGLLEPELLLLDEPTNHLDAPGMSQLADYIKVFPGAVLVVSHDRYFLDEVSQRLIELSKDGARSYQGDYSTYRELKQAEFQHQLALYGQQEQEQRRIERQIHDQMEWARKGHRKAGQQTEARAATPYYRARVKKMAARAKATISRLERLKSERVARPREAERLAISLGDGEKTGRRLVQAEELGKTYDRRLFAKASFSIQRGERVGIVGPNGCGKTTLLRVILGLEPPSEGRVWLSPSANPYYFDQDLRLKDGQTVEEAVESSAVSSGENTRTLLGRLLFRGDDVHKTTELLSQGERVRVSLARLLVSGHNLLALDEPTNYLDVGSREAVEDCLEHYDGTLIVVSHDRYLLKRLCHKVLAIVEGQVRVFHGGFEEYADWQAGAGRASADRAPVYDPEEDRLLLENRVAVLAARLAGPFRDQAEKESVELEYITLLRRLRRSGER